MSAAIVDSWVANLQNGLAQKGVARSVAGNA